MTDFDSSPTRGESDSSAAAERAELIDWLRQEGFEDTQIDRAISPLFLPANRIFGDDGDLASAQEVADASGLPIDLVLRLHHAIGLTPSDDPQAPVYTRADAESVIPAASLIELGIDPEQVLLTVRLLVSGLTQAAVAMRFGGLATILNPGARERQLAQDLIFLAERSKPFIDAMISQIAALTLRRSFETEAITLAERSAGILSNARTVTIAFADVVGFTRLSEELPLDELAHVVNVLVDATDEVVAEPVRFVKTIGDAVMLVSLDAAKLVSVALDLIDHAAEAGLQLRGSCDGNRHEPSGRLVRAAGQCRQSRHRRSAAECRVGR